MELDSQQALGHLGLELGWSGLGSTLQDSVLLVSRCTFKQPLQWPSLSLSGSQAQELLLPHPPTPGTLKGGEGPRAEGGH